MILPFDIPRYYNPLTDGNLEEYFSRQRISDPPRFRGYEQYQMLWNEGYIEPGRTNLIIGQGMLVRGKTYLVNRVDQLEGVIDILSDAEPGVHDPRILLEGDSPPWTLEDRVQNPIQPLIKAPLPLPRIL